jgi:hypothetical protein
VAFVLAVLAFQGVTRVWPLSAAALGSAVSAFNLPARQRSCRRSCRATSAERDQPQHDHVSNRRDARSVARRRVDRGTGVGWAYVANAVSFCSSR